jgi:hypothetical protein
MVPILGRMHAGSGGPVTLSDVHDNGTPCTIIDDRFIPGCFVYSEQQFSQVESWGIGLA